TVDHLPDVRDPADHPAAHVPPSALYAGTSAAPAGDQEAPGALQGRPPAPESGDDEVLPGAQGQSLELVPPGVVAAAVLPVALLHAAARPAAGHLRADGQVVWA